MWDFFFLLDTDPDPDPLTWLNPNPLRIRIRDIDFNKWWVRIRNSYLTIVGCCCVQGPGAAQPAVRAGEGADPGGDPPRRDRQGHHIRRLSGAVKERVSRDWTDQNPMFCTVVINSTDPFVILSYWSWLGSFFYSLLLSLKMWTFFNRRKVRTESSHAE